MRVLIYSPSFLPGLGGLEIIMATVADGLMSLGDEVTVVTTTPGAEDGGVPYRVVRSPGPRELQSWVRWCDVFHQANVSLRGLWPLLLVRRPWVVSHHSWYCRPDGRRIWKDNLKRFLLRFAGASIAVSEAVARDLGVPSVVIPNAYRDRLFRCLEGVRRADDLLFVGRLVSDKGVDLLLDSLALLHKEGLAPTLTIVGSGPEEEQLKEQAERLGLTEQLCWRGPLADEALVAEMNAHAVLVVPSRYREPFGIVALEGIACGCVLVGSEGGGLAEAIGPCGLTFPNGDAAALAAAIRRALEDLGLREHFRSAAPAHLAAHSAGRQAEGYHRAMAAVLARRGQRRRGAAA
ncbi:MAG: glycosyltransferase family 4 protein [Thermoanaerobaculia bacterium]|nr:glycosyltransferase family 4 protein [Thermoanaerobaculia bacterium]